MAFLEKVKQITRNKFFKTAAPFAATITVVWLVTKEFAKIRYESSRRDMITPEDAAAYGVKMKKPGEVSIEKEYEKMKDKDIDSWTNKRIPRPWDEGPIEPMK